MSEGAKPPTAKRGAGRPRKQQGEPDTAGRALDMAEVLLESHGYVATSMSDVAKRVGISKASLYHHFPTKEALFLGVAERMIERDAAGMSLAIASAPTATGQLEALADWMFSQRRHTERMLRDALRFLAPEHAGRIGQIFLSRMYAPVEAVMSAGIERGEFAPHAASFSAWAFMGLLSEFAESPVQVGRPDLAGALVRLLVQGLGPR